MNKIRLKLECF